jgi:hypothetical protein
VEPQLKGTLGVQEVDLDLVVGRRDRGEANLARSGRVFYLGQRRERAGAGVDADPGGASGPAIPPVQRSTTVVPLTAGVQLNQTDSVAGFENTFSPGSPVAATVLPAVVLGSAAGNGCALATSSLAGSAPAEAAITSDPSIAIAVASSVLRVRAFNVSSPSRAGRVRCAGLRADPESGSDRCGVSDETSHHRLGGR